MHAVKAHFDGKTIKMPKDLSPARSAEVLVIFPDPPEEQADAQLWLDAQQTAFAKVWDNDEDAVYDSL